MFENITKFFPKCTINYFLFSSLALYIIIESPFPSKNNKNIYGEKTKIKRYKALGLGESSSIYTLTNKVNSN